jgi:uncharacterized damage-inducible protein DinB
MSTSSPLADAVFQGWKDYQQQLVVTLQALTPEQLNIRVAPQLRTAGEIAIHLVAGRADWFNGVLKEGGDNIAAIAHWEDQGQPTRTAAELAQGLLLTWQVIEDALARWTPEAIEEQIILPWIGPKHPITRAWVFWHVLEHDLHHGGELTHTLGLGGLVVKLPPPPPEDEA